MVVVVEMIKGLVLFQKINNLEKINQNFGGYSLRLERYDGFLGYYGGRCWECVIILDICFRQWIRY